MREEDATHVLTNLVSSKGCRIDKCSCGTYHVRIASMSIKLSREQFRELHGVLGMAAAESLGEALHAN